VGFDFPGRSWGGRKHQIQGGLPGIKFISKLHYEPDRKVLKGGEGEAAGYNGCAAHQITFYVTVPPGGQF